MNDLAAFSSPPTGDEFAPDSGAAGREVELKLELDPDSAEALLDHPLLRDALGAPRQNISVYYDTKKGVLRNAGVSLRVRHNGSCFVQTLKSDSKASAGLHDRWEWEIPIRGPDPELGSAQAIEPILQTRSVQRSLKPVYETRVQRRACTLDRDGARIELVFDRGEVIAGKHIQPLLEVELELLEGSPGSLFDLARELHARVPLQLGVMTKSERGARLASGKAARASKAEALRLTQDMSVADGFRTIALACLRHFRANEPLVISARDVDALHQSRVALRRLRSAFSLFKPVLEGRKFDRFRKDLRSISAELGEARNLDVLIARRSEHMTKASRQKLVAARSRAYGSAISLLKSPEARTTMIDLAEWISLRSARRSGDQPLLPFAQTVLDRYWKKVKRGGGRMRAMDDEDRHALRIAGKKLRYAAEFYAHLYSGPRAGARDDFLVAVEDLQDALGTLNDLATERALEADLAALGIVLPNRPARDRSGYAALLSDSERAYVALADLGVYWSD